MAFYIDAGKNGSSGEIAYLLKKCILHCPKKWTEIVFLCIGSDRVTGDCLGPYIGHLLHPHETGHIFVYGTLSCPVHALNLEKTSSLITRLHPHALVIAIDASLGQKKHLGYVTIGNGALYPGAGVQKDLPPVGDIHITGIVNTAGIMEQLTLYRLGGYRSRRTRIVNTAGIMEQLTLQTTRLSTVVALADVIACGILKILPAETDLSPVDLDYANSLICL